MNKTGIMYVLIRIKFDQDVPVETAEKFVDEMDYTITSKTNEVSIQDTEIVAQSTEMFVP